MKIRKNATTLTGISLTILLVIGLFTGMYLYIADNASNANLTIPENTTTTYSRLIEEQNNLSSMFEDIEQDVDDIKEAENTAFAVWNGMTGIGKALLLPIRLTSIAVQTTYSLLFVDSFMPGWVATLISIAILIIVILTVLGALKGEARL